jgi:hypothetical protein
MCTEFSLDVSNCSEALLINFRACNLALKSPVENPRKSWILHWARQRGKMLPVQHVVPAELVKQQASMLPGLQRSECGGFPSLHDIQEG